ncbi:MAG: aldo/keto reductase [Phycisphaeraceae bacterium]|nr:aldo/keto reductase [Phycisphaeraceae bacterium]MBX3407599.1 aldo/keto reductase [Phycisphaeraceae bacterium]
MELRPLGNTGLRVSVLGLGTVKLGRTRGLKYPDVQRAASLPGDDAATELLACAAEVGITLLDTAPAYGVAEERIGSLMAANNWFGGRERWTLCTKAGEEFDEDGAGGDDGASRFDFSPAAIRASIERSLTRLRTDHIEIALLHSDGRDEWIIRESGAIEELHKLRARGLVRAFGISSKTIAGGLLAAETCDVLMISHSPAHTTERGVIDAAASQGVGVLIKKGLASGHSPDAGAAIRFVLGTPGVSSMIVGTSSAAHLRENARNAAQAVRGSAP